MRNQVTLTPALFLDRDGVINREVGYVSSTSQLEFNSEIFKICRFFKSKCYKIVIITNQSGIGRNLIGDKNYAEINWFISRKFKEELCEIDLILTSTLNPSNTHATKEEIFLRKPNPGMILKAQNDLNLDVFNSILIGDKITDMQAGYAAGVKNLMLINEKLYREGYFDYFSDFEGLTAKLKEIFDPTLSWDWK